MDVPPGERLDDADEEPPMIAPGMLPSPPSTVAANARRRRLNPTSGERRVSGAISTAAALAMHAPVPQVMV